MLAFPSGSKILINELEFTTGGGGTNTAVALSRLGHKVAFLGKLGDGTNSDFIHKELVKEKIDLLCAHGKGHAGYSVILDTLEHDRTILTHKGINDELKIRDVPLKKLRTKWFYFSSMMNESFKTQEKLAKFAEKNGIKIAFNPSTYLAQKGKKYLEKILDTTELLVLNKEEAALLVGKGTFNEMLSELKKLGPKIVVITDGRHPFYAMDDKVFYTISPSPVKILDTTGAGDAFAASLLSGLVRKKGMEFSLMLGVTNAQSVIQHYGAKNVLLSYSQALRQMKKIRIKVAKKKI